MMEEREGLEANAAGGAGRVRPARERVSEEISSAGDRELTQIGTELETLARRARGDRAGDRSGAPGALRRPPRAEEGGRRRRADRRRLPGLSREALGHGDGPDQARRGRPPVRALPPDRDPSVKVVVVCDGAARGNPGPAGIGAAVLTPRGRGARRDRGGDRRDHEQRRGVHGRARGSPPSGGARRRRGRAPIGLPPARRAALRSLSRQGGPPAAAARGRAGRGPADRRVTFRHVPREQNTHADRLANVGVDAWLAQHG